MFVYYKLVGRYVDENTDVQMYRRTDDAQNYEGWFSLVLFISFAFFVFRLRFLFHYLLYYTDGPLHLPNITIYHLPLTAVATIW